MFARQQTSFSASTSTAAPSVTYYIYSAARKFAPECSSTTREAVYASTSAWYQRAANDAAMALLTQSKRMAAPWYSRAARLAWETTPRLLAPPKLVITSTLWNIALASPKLMSNPAAFCSGLPLVKEVRCFRKLEAAYVHQHCSYQRYFLCFNPYYC